jgi:quercetin dioxygenase-like cupin family protein/DNA-binding Xre family transcriptional regulator
MITESKPDAMRGKLRPEESRIGLRVRHARLTRSYKLQTLADKVGCSVSLLSKIENRRANPSLTMLHRICEALDTNLSEMFFETSAGDSIMTREDQRPMISTDQLNRGHGIQLQRLVPNGPGFLLQGNVHVIQPGGYSTVGLMHDGEELGYVLEGTIQLTVDGEDYTGNAGDSFFYRSERPHSYKNVGKYVARIIWVNTPPTF